MTRLDALRNLMGIVNRFKNPTAENVATITNLVSPPYKGVNPNPTVHSYPECLSGLHGQNKQRIMLSGSCQGNSGFAGVVPGSPTGGSYRT